MIQSQRAIGALVGSAVGDALGAPFDFSSAGAFTKRFPTPARGPKTEMIGGGRLAWKPGEFTDNTQLALILGESLSNNIGFDGTHIFDQFRSWAPTVKDVDIATRAVLDDGDWQHSATRQFKRTGAGTIDRSLARAITSALFASTGDGVNALQLGRAQAALTNGDPAAGWAAATYHAMIQSAVRGESPLAMLPSLLNRLPVDHSRHFRSILFADGATPNVPANGNVWTCLGHAVRAATTSASFEGAVRQACDVGGDAHTVACVTGGLAGALFGIQSIPSRWANVVHGTVIGKVYRNRELQDLAFKLIGQTPSPYAHEVALRGPVEITDGVFAANTRGALDAPSDWAVLSLCRIGEVFMNRHHRREFFLIDRDNANPGLELVVHDVLAEIEAFRAAGIPVVVHCELGESRTAFILRAWLMHAHGIKFDEADARFRSVWPHMGHLLNDFELALRNFGRIAL